MTTPAALLLILLVGAGCDSIKLEDCGGICKSNGGRMAKYNATEGCVCEYGNK